MSEEILRNWVVDRNALIPNERREAVQRIVQLNVIGASDRGKRREVAVAHRLGKDACLRGSSLVETRTQIIDKEEQLVALDGTAEGASELRLGERIDREGRGVVIIRPGVRVGFGGLTLTL